MRPTSGHARLHRHPQPLRLHAAHRSARDERGPQGVTLEVIGNCGFGCARSPNPGSRRTPSTATIRLPLTWQGIGGYLEKLEAARPAINVMTLMPNGQLRLVALGLADRPARAARARPDGASSRGARQGAFGYSTGLEYAAERGPRGELVSLSRGSVGRHASSRRTRDTGTRERRGGRGGVRMAARGRAAAGLAPGPAERHRVSRRCVELVEESASAGRTSRSTCTRAFTAPPSCSPRFRPRRLEELRTSGDSGSDEERRKLQATRACSAPAVLAHGCPPRQRCLARSTPVAT